MVVDVASLADVPVDDALTWAEHVSLGVWHERRRGFVNEQHHWEWCAIVQVERRACVVAPRDTAKSEIACVSQIAWRSEVQPGHWAYVFSDTAAQSESKLRRIVDAVEQSAPWLVDGMLEDNASQVVFANGSKVTASSAGKSVRGDHPDLIVADDVLEESKTLTAYQRQKTLRWWTGTVSNMAHPGRVTPDGHRFPATKIHVIGTPFHRDDLLAKLRANEIFAYARYAAEFDPRDLVPGTLAVELHRCSALPIPGFG